MKIEDLRNVEELHHAYLMSGGAELIDMVLGQLEKIGVKVKGNPDLYLEKYQVMKVEAARELRERAAMKPVGGGKQFFIITCAGMTSEAQNALLKILEEPTGESVFFFILPSAEGLLPTLRSRTQLLTVDAKTNYGHPMSIINVGEFLGAGAKDRIEMIKTLLPQKPAEEKDTNSALAFLAALETQLSGAKERGSEWADGLKAIYRAKRHLSGGASMKILLEQVALLVPKM